MLISSLYKRLPAKYTVNVRRHNSIQLKRKLRLASFVPAPILRKGFKNTARLIVK